MEYFNINNDSNGFDKIPTEVDHATPMKLIRECRDQFIHKKEQQQFVLAMNRVIKGLG